jgi:hypothetical protein
MLEFKSRLNKKEGGGTSRTRIQDVNIRDTRACHGWVNITDVLNRIKSVTTNPQVLVRQYRINLIIL